MAFFTYVFLEFHDDLRKNNGTFDTKLRHSKHESVS